MPRSQAGFEHFKPLSTRDLTLARSQAHLYQGGNPSKQGSPEFTP